MEQTGYNDTARALCYNGTNADILIEEVGADKLYFIEEDNKLILKELHEDREVEVKVGDLIMKSPNNVVSYLSAEEFNETYVSLEEYISEK